MLTRGLGKQHNPPLSLRIPLSHLFPSGRRRRRRHYFLFCYPHPYRHDNHLLLCTLCTIRLGPFSLSDPPRGLRKRHHFLLLLSRKSKSRPYLPPFRVGRHPRPVHHQDRARGVCKSGSGAEQGFWTGVVSSGVERRGDFLGGYFQSE